MKSIIRILAFAAFLTSVSSVRSLASTLLCQTGPVNVAGSGSLVPMYTCAIPANAVPSGKSIRVTVALGSIGAVLSDLVLNGTETYDAEPPSGLSFWQFTIANTGGTTGSMAGFKPTNAASQVAPFASQNASPATLPWASGWTLRIEVLSDTGVTGRDPRLIRRGARGA
jgi:hypothetical protein